MAEEVVSDVLVEEHTTEKPDMAFILPTNDAIDDVEVLNDPLENFGNREILVKNIVRYLSTSGRTLQSENVFSSQDVDEYLSFYVDAGFDIVGVQYIGSTPEGVGVLYTLQKRI